MKRSFDRFRCLRYACALALSFAAVACGGGGGDAGGEMARFDYPTALDTSFGNGGYRVHSTGLDEKAFLSSFTVGDFTIDSAGRFVVVGTRTSSNREAWILRLRPDGTPDESCGKGGWASFTTGGPAIPRRIVQLPDGRYVLGGNLGVSSLWAIKGDCTVDTSFGTDGRAVIPSPSPTEIQETVNALLVDAQGMLVATVGSTMSGKLLVARLDASGMPDPHFGGGSGYASVAAPDGGSPQPGAIVVRPDGRILVAISMVYNSQVGYWPGYVQLLENGDVDEAFGTKGFVSVKPSPNFVATPKSMVLLEDGSAIQAGVTQPGVLVGTVIEADAYWLKIGPSGMPDAGFGQGGFAMWSAGPEGRARSSNYAVDLLADGNGFLTCQNWVNNTKVAKQVEAASLQVLVQRRATASGALSAGFANGGTGWLPRGQDAPDACVGLRRGVDGKVYALLDYGPAQRATGETMALVRLN